MRSLLNARPLLTLCFLSLLCTYLPPATAAVIRVDQSAPGPTHDGTTWPTAWLTIQEGVNAAQPGDEVWVASAGGAPYLESITVLRSIALYGGFAGNETEREQRDWRAFATVLETATPLADEAVNVSANDVLIDGFAVRNRTTGIYASSCTLSIRNCLFRGPQYPISAPFCQLRVEYTTFRDAQVAIQVDTGSAVIVNSTVSGGLSGIVLQRTTGSIVNCSIIGHAGTALSIDNGTVTVVNTLLAHNGTGISRPQSAGEVTLSHNNLFGNTANYANITDPAGSNGNISLDPKVSHWYRDVHIQPDSPCIDSGDNSAVTGALDIDGQPRIQGERVDIGSDESDGTFWPAELRVARVSPAGSDTEDGSSWGQAYRSIGAALKAMPGFDEVWVAAGSYRDSFSIPTGVSLYGGFAGTESSRGQRSAPTGLTVLDGSGIAVANLVGMNNPNTRLDGFVLQNATNGIFVGQVTANIANCTIAANAKMGIWVSGGNARVTGCTISGNGGYGLHAGNGSADVTNSLIAYNPIGVAKSTGTITLRNSNVFGNTIWNFSGLPDPTGTNGNISRDPKLTSPYYNIHIKPGSPCIDVGDDSAVDITSPDIDGQPRIQGDHVDIGSDESDGTLWPDISRIVRVSMAGSDANDGSTWAMAKRSVASALISAHDGDEVWVANGLYRENVTVSSGVSLYGGFAGTETSVGQRDWEAHPTTLHGNYATSGAIITVDGLGVIIDGFTLQNGGAGVRLNGGSAQIAHCMMTLNVTGVSTGDTTAVTVSDCVVYDNSSVGLSSEGAATVRNSTIALNGNHGVIHYSTFPLSVTNSIVAYNTYYGVKSGDPRAQVTFSHNNSFGNGNNYWAVPDPTGTNGNISVAPLFFNQPGGNLRLAAGSPCIDAGDDAAVAPGERDLDGKPRRIGPHVDMGAYEYGTLYTTMADAALALRITAGHEVAPLDISRLNIDPSPGLDLLDATRLIRKAAGLDANP